MVGLSGTVTGMLCRLSKFSYAELIVLNKNIWTIEKNKTLCARIGARSSVPESTCVRSLVVNSSIQSTHNLIHPYLENSANAKERADCDGSARFDLLPMTGRKTERDHILLAVSGLLAQSSDALTHCLEKLCLVYHTSACTVARAETPRAD